MRREGQQRVKTRRRVAVNERAGFTVICFAVRYMPKIEERAPVRGGGRTAHTLAAFPCRTWVTYFLDLFRVLGRLVTRHNATKRQLHTWKFLEVFQSQ